MTTQSWTRLLPAAFITVIGIGCGTQKGLTENDNISAGFVDADGTHETLTPDTLRNPFPHLLMTDGRITLNDRCPVRKAILNKRLPALFVNGRPLGFC